MDSGTYLIAVIAGFLGGFLGPLIGVGGGVVIVPMLNLSGIQFQRAVAASLFSIVVTSSVSLYNYRRNVNLKILARYGIISLMAAVISAFISVHYSGDWVKLAYGIYLIIIGFVLLENVRPRKSLPWLGYVLIFVGGFVSSLFGIGGGTIFVPALILVAGLDPRIAVAMSMGIILPTVSSSTVTYAVLGVLNLFLAVAVAIGSFVGSFISSRYIMPRLSSSSIRRLFVAYVFAMGLYYLWIYITSLSII